MPHFNHRDDINPYGLNIVATAVVPVFMTIFDNERDATGEKNTCTENSGND